MSNIEGSSEFDPTLTAVLDEPNPNASDYSLEGSGEVTVSTSTSVIDQSLLFGTDCPGANTTVENVRDNVVDITTGEENHGQLELFNEMSLAKKLEAECKKREVSLGDLICREDEMKLLSNLSVMIGRSESVDESELSMLIYDIVNLLKINKEKCEENDNFDSVIIAKAIDVFVSKPSTDFNVVKRLIDAVYKKKFGLGKP